LRCSGRNRRNRWPTGRWTSKSSGRNAACERCPFSDVTVGNDSLVGGRGDRDPIYFSFSGELSVESDLFGETDCGRFLDMIEPVDRFSFWSVIKNATVVNGS
jgi:hypothetical protein